MAPLILDLYCGAGGAAMGYHQAGFKVIGVDLYPQKHYPFEFRQMDALEALDYMIEHNPTGWPYVAIHASPPCQAHSDLQKQNKRDYPDLIAPTRERLERIGLPYVIENVDGAPLIEPAKFCGANDDVFPELRVIRHRLFETNWPLDGVPCPKPRHPLVFTHDKRKPHYGRLDPNQDYVQVTGGGNCPVAAARDAMRIDWMTKKELNEAIPPAFTRHIGTELLSYLASGTNPSEAPPGGAEKRPFSP
jgi:DNA (cytosine-5)-methyltransferase 1